MLKKDGMTSMESLLFWAPGFRKEEKAHVSSSADSALKGRFDTRNPLLEAYHLEESGKKEEAIRAYEEILIKNPDYEKAYTAHNQLALLYKENKKFSLALKHIEKAIKLKPELSSLYVNKGNILRDFKRPKKAIEAYQKALALNPEFKLAQNQLFNLLKKHGSQKEVKDLRAKVLSLDKREKSIDAHLREASELIQEKKFNLIMLLFIMIWAGFIFPRVKQRKQLSFLKRLSLWIRDMLWPILI